MIAAVAQHEELRTYGEQHRALWRCAWEQIRALDVSLARQQKESFAAQIARLQTIPGVGPIVASTAIAVFSTPERFPDAKHAASYAGLVPSTYQSGEHEAHGRITKRLGGIDGTTCSPESVVAVLLALEHSARVES